MLRDLLAELDRLDAELARVRAQFQRSQERWGNLKTAIQREADSFADADLTLQQRSQYANGVARLRWVIDQMRKSPDVLAEMVTEADAGREG